MFDQLSDRLQATLSEVRSRGKLSEADVDAAMREIRLALLEADVNFKVVKAFTKTLKERCLGAEVLESLDPGQQVVKIVNEELAGLMGVTGSELAMASIVGVQVWRTLPLATVIQLGGLSSIPQELHDAAEVDGAGFWRRLFGITLPLLSPVMTVALLFGIVFTFTDMAAVFVLTGGGPGNATQVLASWAFYKGINGGNLAVGAADALIMFPVLLGLAAILLRIASRAEVG